MKRPTAMMLSLLLAAALLLGTAAAAGGDANDPLISLDYLRTVFAPKAEQAAQEKLDASGKAVYDAAEAKWKATVAAIGPDAVEETPGGWIETRVKGGDVLMAPTGTQIMLLAGEDMVQFSSGTVVDVTDGTELMSVAYLKARHRYLVAEDTNALFTVASRTAVVMYCGGTLSRSGSAPDYNAMAAALKSLSLLRGTGSGYGEGFDLELTPTRIEALVMLIRLLGEEGDALLSTAVCPFTDVPLWADRYVAYAYERGYTNGVSATQFAPAVPASAGMYVEFVLRALGYSSTAQTDVSTAVDRALAAGVITPGEQAQLQSNSFLRADVVYLSWYALDVPLPGGMTTLREKLESVGVFTEAAYQNASALVQTERVR